MRRLPLSLVVITLGCSSAARSPGDTLVEWQPLDSVNADLPRGIRVYAGANDTYPLRAWYVVIDQAHASLGTHVRVSDDLGDGREMVTSFADEPGTCVAVNGGYFSMDRTPAVHGGLLVLDGHVVAPATASVTRDSIAYPTARAAIGWRADGAVELRWAASRGDSVLAWNAPPANRPGAPATLAWGEALAWPVVQAQRTLAGVRPFWTERFSETYFSSS